MSTLHTRSAGLQLVHETLLGEALMAGSLPVVVTDEAMRYVAVNQSACAFLGYSREELLELSVAAVVPRSTAELADAMRHVLRSGSLAGATTVRRGDRTEIDVEWVSFPTTVAGVSHVVTVMWEATGRIPLELRFSAQPNPGS